MDRRKTVINHSDRQVFIRLADGTRWIMEPGEEITLIVRHDGLHLLKKSERRRMRSRADKLEKGSS